MLRIAYPRSSEGPSPETRRRRSGEWRPAAAARDQGPGRSGTPPARHYDLAVRSSLHKSGRNAGDGSAAPDRKSPRWSAERRARPAGRAPRLRKRGPSRAETRDNRKTAPFGAPLAPHGADGKEESNTRAQQRAAGTKKTALFDRVNRNVRQRARSRPRAHPGAPSEARCLSTLVGPLRLHGGIGRAAGERDAVERHALDAAAEQ